MTENKIIEQIRQLLRIASDRGASVNERELAQRRAERLMVRYRIESLPEGDARAPRTRTLPRWRWRSRAVMRRWRGPSWTASPPSPAP
nr:MAG TPA: Protein of unknown function (DUF2786) [Caudoviricetes sp.]